MCFIKNTVENKHIVWILDKIPDLINGRLQLDKLTHLPKYKLIKEDIDKYGWGAFECTIKTYTGQAAIDYESAQILQLYYEAGKEVY